MTEKMGKTEKTLFYASLAGFCICLIGALAFLLKFALPSLVAPSYYFTGIFGQIFVTYPWLNLDFGALIITFPWFNFVALIGLIILAGSSLARLAMKGKSQTIYRLLLIGFLVCAALTLPGIAYTVPQQQQQPPTNNWYNYPTPTPYWTYPPNPTASPYPTYDPNNFGITQRVNVETITTYYMDPTSYSVDPVITSPSSYTHAISIYGTYDNWSYDVYVQVGSDDAFWTYVDSYMTDGSGNGAAYVPYFASDAGQVHNVVAVINPNGGAPTNYGGFTAGELISLVNAGTLRESNHLSFSVVASNIL